LDIETLSGIKKLILNIRDNKVDTVKVNMGKPILKSADIPVVFEKDRVIREKVEIGDGSVIITCVSMGNPHCVVFCDKVDDLDLEKIGPIFENHKMFPDRINTEFVEMIDENTLKMRVWERGSGETMACGTGACAVVVAAVLNDLCKKGSEITVKLRGGDLRITYAEDDYVYMTGGAEFVFEGEVLNV